MLALLIRHGQTDSNVLGLLDSGTPGPDLTALGRAQAAAIPAALAARFPGQEWGEIHVSTLVRTAQTAAPLAEALGRRIVIDERLREIEAGDVEMLGDPDSYRAYVSAAWAWAEGRLDVPMRGAPGGSDFFARFDAAMEAAARDAVAPPVVVSHGASIRVWVANRCENIPGSAAAGTELHNTGSVLVDRDADGRWTLVAWDPHPLGGEELDATVGADPTGEAV